jgi:hypothetical protein
MERCHLDLGTLENGFTSAGHPFAPENANNAPLAEADAGAENR